MDPLDPVHGRHRLGHRPRLPLLPPGRQVLGLARLKTATSSRTPLHGGQSHAAARHPMRVSENRLMSPSAHYLLLLSLPSSQTHCISRLKLPPTQLAARCPLLLTLVSKAALIEARPNGRHHAPQVRLRTSSVQSISERRSRRDNRRRHLQPSLETITLLVCCAVGRSALRPRPQLCCGVRVLLPRAHGVDPC